MGRALLRVAWLLAVACSAKPPPPAAPPRGAMPPATEERLAGVRRLTAGGGVTHVGWSGDGRELLAVARHGRACPYLLALDSSAHGPAGAVKAVSPFAATSAVFSTGDEVLFTAPVGACPIAPGPFSEFAEAPVALWHAKVNGTGRGRSTASPGAVGDLAVCRPRGILAFSSTREGEQALYVAPLERPDEAKRLTLRAGADRHPAFSPDCSLIAWQGLELARSVRPTSSADSEALPATEIFVANADGSAVRQLTYLAGQSGEPVFTPDGLGVVFSSNFHDPERRETDLWTVGIDGANLEQVTHTPGLDRAPAFSPQGSTLAFVSARHGGQEEAFVAEWRQREQSRVVLDAAGRIARDARELTASGASGPCLPLAVALAERFATLGLRPAAPDYLAPVPPFRDVQRRGPTYLRVMGLQARYSEFEPLPMSRTGEVRAQLVGVGFGIRAPELGYDDYEGVDVRGKLAVVQRFVPDLAAFASLQARRDYGDLRRKLRDAAAAGAVGVMLVDGGSEPGQRPSAAAEAPFPDVVANTYVESPLFALAVSAGTLGSAWPRLRAGRPVWVELGVYPKTGDAPGDNVVGVLPATGGGRAEPLVISARLGDAAGKGSADAAASVDVATLLEVARALAAAPRRARPTLFVALAGGHQGYRGGAASLLAFLRREGAPGAFAALQLGHVDALGAGSLHISGAESAKVFRPWLAEHCPRWGLPCDVPPGRVPAEEAALWARAGIAALHLGGAAAELSPALNASGAAQVAGLVTSFALGESPVGAALSAHDAPWLDLRAGEDAFGVTLSAEPGSAGGALLVSVAPDSPAAEAGLVPGDQLVRLGERSITDQASLRQAMAALGPHATVTAWVLKGSAEVGLTVVF